MPVVPPRVIAPLVAAAAIAFAACGPSFQVVYEGDARFEHCYALDDTATVPMTEKTECWTQWMQAYTYGQTRNRIDYAAMRAKALRDAPVIPTDEALMSAAPGGGVTRNLTHEEPVTTNAFAPPPKTLGEGDAAVETPETPPPPVAPQAPREACTDRCHGQWTSCRATCKTKCGECDSSYGGCMKGCF